MPLPQGLLGLSCPLIPERTLKFIKGFVDRLRASRSVDDEEEDRLGERIDRLYDLKDYPLTVLELSFSVPEEQVAEVFVRINSKGTPLNQADFILTLMSVFWDQGRAELEAFCREAKVPPSGSKPSPYNFFLQPEPDQMLRVNVALGFRRAALEHVYSLLRGKDLESKQFSVEQRDRQFSFLRDAQEYALDLTRWHAFFKALVRAGYRSRKMVSSQNAMLYTYALYLIGRRDFGLDFSALHNVIPRWFFMVSLTGRYTGSPESRMEQDLALLRGLNRPEDYIEALDREMRSVLTDDYWNITLPNQLATASAQSPGRFAYYAALCILDARALYSKMKVSDLLDEQLKVKKSSLDRHHLFPRRYLEKIGISERRVVNQVANYTLVEWFDDISISDKPPSVYAPKYEEKLSQSEREEMYFWHALPDRWYDMEYLEFLE